MKTLSKFALAIIMFTATIACKNNASTEAVTETVEDTSAQMITETPKSVEKVPGMATLSFKMDGALVEATVPGVMALYIPSKNEANIRGNTPMGMFAIVMDQVYGPGIYTINGTSKSGAGIFKGSTMHEVKKTGTPFTVTIDAVEDIAAYATPDAKAIRGTFEGTIMDEAGNSIRITEGKFSSQ